MANRKHVATVLADIMEEREKGLGGFNMKDFIHVVPYDSFEADDTFLLEAGQSPTICGTALCVAGFAALEAGWTFKFRKVEDTYNGNYVKIDPINPLGERSSIDWDEVGREYLDINEEIGGLLFYATFDGGEAAIEILKYLLEDPNADSAGVRIINNKARYVHEMNAYGRTAYTAEGGYSYNR